VVETAATVYGENVKPANDPTVQVANGVTANIDNTLPTVDITAKKQWQDKDGTVLDGSEGKEIPDGASVTFTLLADGKATDHRVELNGVDETKEPETQAEVTPTSSDYEGAGWTAYFTSLPKYTDAGALITYTVAETGAWDGFEVLNENPVSTGDTIVNKQKSIDINILKISDTENALSGAKFQLKQYDEEYSNVLKTWEEAEVSSEEATKGTLKIEGLTTGFYELIETKSPAGYVKTSTNPRFEVRVNVNGTTKELEVLYTDSTDGMVSYASDNNTFTVKNTPGTALPITGGPGTWLFTILGGILVLGAGVLLWRRRRNI